MLNANKTGYYYEDEHLYFWFGDTHSSKYKLFIVSKNDLKIENDTGASTEYNNAMFQEGTYLLGTSRKQKTFKREVAAEGLTLAEYKNMMLWLCEGATGFLCFDSNPYWGWSVVLEKVGDATVTYGSQGMVVEFDLTWKTVGSYLARNRYDSSGIVDPDGMLYKTYYMMNNNSYGLPSYWYVPDNTDSSYILYDVVNIGNIGQNFDYYTTLNFGQNVFEVNTQFASTLINYAKVGIDTPSQGTNIKYLGASNLIFADELLAEEHPLFTNSSQTNGLLFMNGRAPLVINTTDELNLAKNLGYTHIVRVKSVSNLALWNVDYDSARTTHEIIIYKVDDNITLSSGANIRYYAVTTTRIAILGGSIESNIEEFILDQRTLNYATLGGSNSTCLIVHSYNNL